MKRLVTAREMREMDRLTIEGVGIPGLLLMEAASRAVADAACDLLGQSESKKVAVFCGKGNNGGDGMAAARHLFSRGVEVSVFLAGNPGSLKGDALVQWTILKGMGIPVSVLRSQNDLRGVRAGDLVIDALLGTGLVGDVEEPVASVLAWINRSGRPVLSVDLPSGLWCDTGSFGNACVHAARTVTLGELKRGLVLYPGRQKSGRVDVVDIGIPDSVASSVGINTFWVESGDATARLPERPAWAHKGAFGKTLILAGSTGMTGAAALCSSAVLRTGAGLAVLGTPSGLNSIMEEKLTEVMTKPLPQTDSGSLSLDAVAAITDMMGWADVLALGPGLSRHPETAEVVRKTVARSKRPTVIDADGINAFEGHAELLEKKKGPFILTPHSGELSRLTGLSVEAIERDRIETARTAAKRFGCVIVLKGAPTVTACPDGCVTVNSTGNSGMATAGAGDVLTGILAGLLAQGLSPADAALCGVFLHGLAGDLAASAKSARSITAGDIADFLGAAFQSLEAGH